MANKQRFYCPRGSNSVILLTRGSSYDVHYRLNLNRRSTNSPVTDCGDNALSGDTHIYVGTHLRGISKTAMVCAS